MQFLKAFKLFQFWRYIESWDLFYAIMKNPYLTSYLLEILIFAFIFEFLWKIQNIDPLDPK